jgi:hypothetical protein
VARLAPIPLVLLALLGATAASYAAEEAEEPGESAYVEEAVEGCEEDPVCLAEAKAEEEAEAEAADRRECALRSARAHAVVKGEKLKIAVGYSTYEPVQATIRIDSGATRLGSFQRHLRRSGVLRFTETLRSRQAPKRVVVRIRLATGGAGCPAGRLVLRG